MKFNRIALILFTIVLGITTLYGGLIIWLNWPLRDFSLARSSVFGESFGVLNSVFSGLAFAALVLTLYLQRHELAASQETFRNERFEDSFYRLLDYYRRNLDDIRIVDHHTGQVHTGVGALTFLVRKLHTTLQKYSPLLESGTDLDLKAYNFKVFVETRRVLGRQTRYLGTLECLLEQIEQELPTLEARVPYWRILMSQLTITEVKYIFYTCLVAPQGDPLRELIHRSSLSRQQIIEGTINHRHLDFYQELHGVRLTRNRPPLRLPYEGAELSRIRKRLAKGMEDLP